MKKKQYFGKIRRWWGQQSIRQQILLSLFIVSMLGIWGLGLSSYYISRNTVEQNYKKAHETTLKNSRKVLDMNMESIIDITRSFLNSSGLQNVMEEREKDGGYTFTMEEQKVLKRVAEGLTEQERWVNFVAFMDLKGHYYMLSNINVGAYDFYQYYSQHDFLDEEWAEEVRAENGKEVFFGDVILHGVADKGFSIAKYMINPTTREPMGYVVINVSNSILARSFVNENEGYETNEYIVIDRDRENQLIYHSQTLKNTEEIMKAYKNRAKQGKYVFSSVYDDVTDWELVNVVESNELSRESKMIRNFVLLFGVVLLGLSFLFAKLISRSIAHPLTQLEQVIEKVGDGERHITEEFDDSEVGKIGQKFKEMVNTNLELSEHLLNAKLNEREAELLLLQSQINPHFLYNTLDSLYCIAIIHEDDQIADMALALSNHFKLALNNGQKFCMVSDAVMQIQEYMKLQNIRFNDRFELRLDVNKEILDERILTFILQPFVENALYHGLEPKIGKGKITVRGWREDENLIFTVEDDGVGMDDISVLETGYAIQNVRERIHLNYGETYGFTAESKKGQGTKITITLPVKQGGR